LTQRQVKDMAASVRDRIRTIHRRTGLDYNLLITRYYQERLLKRMVQIHVSEAGWRFGSSRPHRPVLQSTSPGLIDYFFGGLVTHLEGPAPFVT